MLASSIKEIFFAFFAIDSRGFSINVSISSPIQKMMSACSIIFACEGFNTKLCGDVLPSIIKEGSPTPSITFEINECRGLIVVTTFISAFAAREPANKTAKI